jgi:hypothetical protein
VAPSPLGICMYNKGRDISAGAGGTRATPRAARTSRRVPVALDLRLPSQNRAIRGAGRRAVSGGEGSGRRCHAHRGGDARVPWTQESEQIPGRRCLLRSVVIWVSSYYDVFIILLDTRQFGQQGPVKRKKTSGSNKRNRPPVL